MTALTDRLDRAVRHLWDAERESQPSDDHPAVRPVVAYAHRREALRLLGAVHRDLGRELDAASEAVEEHLIAQGVRKLSLTEPAVTLFIERRPFCGVVYADGEDKDAGHERLARALEASGLGEFARTRVNLKGLTAHYREQLEAEGEEAVNARLAVELGGAAKLDVTTKVKTRKAG